MLKRVLKVVVNRTRIRIEGMQIHNQDVPVLLKKEGTFINSISQKTNNLETICPAKEEFKRIFVERMRSVRIFFRGGLLSAEVHLRAGVQEGRLHGLSRWVIKLLTGSWHHQVGDPVLNRLLASAGG